MGFSSAVGKNEIIIHDGNYRQYASEIETPEGMSRGYVPRDYAAFPEGAFGTRFDLPLIPRSEWQARIQELTERKALISDLRKHYNVKSRNQNGTNYCWFHGVVTSIIARRMAMGLPYVDLSPASGAAVIKQGRNQGGWGSQALEYCIEHGVADSSVWPHNQLSGWSQLDNKPEVKASKAKNRVTEWWELKPRNLDEMVTCLLELIPIAVGYNWWSHEVCGIDPLWLDGEFALRIWNSWGDSWSDNGTGILQGSRILADDAVAPRVLLAA